MKRLISLLPTTIDRRVRVLAWLSLIVQVVLVGTGGAVRLTGSGLGCPTWPLCTDDSLVSTPEMGIHGIIEFGNRLLTVVVVVIAILVFLLVWRFRKQRRDLFTLTLLQGLSIPLQAVIGGITVLTGLNSYIVGLHLVISLGLVVVTTMLVYRVYFGTRGERRALPSWFRITAHLTSLVVLITVVVGVLTTGSGPHAGDADTPRNGLNPELMQHIHSWPAYITLALTLVLVVAVFALKLPRRWVFWLLSIEAAQIIVGLTQARLGLPAALVIVHMVLAAMLIAAMTAVIISLRYSSTDYPLAEAATPGERLSAQRA